MAKQVENRVVEMEFKNKDFEKAVSVTMKSLEELNEKLDSLNNVNVSGFENVTDKLNNTNFDKLSENIDYLKGRFSFLGEAVHDIWGDIVDGAEAAMIKIEQTITKPLDIIEEKGKARATNLAQAKFQLSNLGVSWNAIKEDIDYAVNDTRFGLDEAAMAASQLSASGVEIGEEMKHALLGISGVAAMTNSEFSEIAHIFTTVAGTGKLYTQQLNMIASRGLNATAAIADYLGITEAQVREIIADKDEFIDFATFAEAMWAQYGESAKKGNDLFSGALANAKAALGRIGEKFYTPFYEYARQVLVAVKPVINDINSALTPMFNMIDTGMERIKDMFVYAFNLIHSALDPNNDDPIILHIFGDPVDIKSKLTNLIDWINTAIDGIVDTLTGSGLTSIVGETLVNVFYNVYEVINLIVGAFNDVFGEIDDSGIVFVADQFRQFTESMKLNEKEIQSLRSALGGLLSIFDIVYNTADAIFKVFIKPLIPGLRDVEDGVLGVTGNIGEMLQAFDEVYNPFEPLRHFAAEASIVFAKPIGAIKKLVSTIVEEFQKLTGIHDTISLFETLKEAVTDLHLDDLFMFIGGAILYCVQQISDFITALNDNSFKQYMADMKENNTVLAWIADKYEKLKTNLNELFTGKKKLSDLFDVEKIKEKFAFLTPILDTFKEHYQTIISAPAGSTEGLPLIDQFAVQLRESIKNLKWDDIFAMIGAGFYAWWKKKSAEFLESISGTFKNFSDAFAQLSEGVNMSLVRMTKETDAEKILKIAAGVALLAGSIVLLGKLNPQEIMTGLAALLAVSVMIVLVVKALSKAMETTEKFEKEYDLEKEGISSKLSSKKGKGKKGSIIEKAFERVGSSFEYGKEKVDKTMKDLSTVPGVILALGASVWLIISSMVKLSKMIDTNPAAVTASFIMIGIILAAVSQFAIQILKFVADENNKIDQDVVNSISKMFLLMGIAIRLVAGAIGSLALITKFAGIDNMVSAGAIIGLILAEMATIAWLLTKYVANNDKVDPKTMLAVGGMFALMAVAIQMLTIPIAAIAVVGALGGQIWQAAGIVALLLAEMAIIAGLIGYFVGETAGGAVSMLAAGAAMLMMGMAISSLTIPLVAVAAIAHFSQNGELDAAVATIIGLMAVMGLIVALFGAVSGGTAGMGAVGMLAGAAAMLIIAEAIQALLVPLAAIAALNATGSFWEAFAGLAAGIGLLAAAALIAIPLAPGLATLAGVLVSFGSTVMMIGAGIGAAGIGVFAFIKALETLQNIDFTNMATKVGQAGAAIIHGFTGALVGGIPDITNGFKALLGGGLGALVQSLPMIVEFCVVLLNDVIAGIDNHAQELGFHLGHALFNIISYALVGIGAGLIDLVEKLIPGGGNGGFSKYLFEQFFPEKESQGTVGDKLKGFFGGNEAKEAVEESTEELGETGSQSLLDSFNLPTGGVQTKMDEAFNGLDMSGLSLKGTEGGESLLGGFEDSLKIQGGQSLASADLSTMVDKGFLEGSDFNLDDYKQNGKDKVAAFFEGAQEEADSHSPSRRAMELAGFIDEGFAIGLNKSHLGEDAAEDKMSGIFSIFSSISEVTNKSINGSALNSLRETISGIAEVATSDAMDFAPTISPVLDMTNIQSGFSTLDSMFNRSRSVALAGDVSSMDAANRMMNFEIQNDKSGSFMTGFNSLGGKLDRLGEAIMNRQIVLDSGELVGGLRDPMDRSLGVKTIRAQRSGRR